MPVISNLDHLVLQLQKQLSDRARRDGFASGKQSAVSDKPLQLLDSVGTQASAAHQAGGNPRAVARVALEEMLLADFGREFANDAGFIDIVDRVAEALYADAHAWAEFVSVIGKVSRA